jgi:AhpD family alkylhydroperoxidase
MLGRMTSTADSSTDHVVHPQRIDLPREAREAYRAMAALDRSVELDHGLRELIKIRASQINGCAYCLDMHLHDAREAGESLQRLDTLSAWRESPFFTPRERAAFALTEAVTLIHAGPVPDAVYDEAARWFEPAELAQVLFAIVAINAWNRIAITAQTTTAAR